MNRDEIRNELERGNLVAPPVNIYETDDTFILKANMPGARKESVDVTISDGELLIYGRVSHEEDECDCVALKEINDSNYYRTFRVGDAIDLDHEKAHVQDGVLRVTLPKKEHLKPKEIPIEVV